MRTCASVFPVDGQTQTLKYLKYDMWCVHCELQHVTTLGDVRLVRDHCFHWRTVGNNAAVRCVLDCRGFQNTYPSPAPPPTVFNRLQRTTLTFHHIPSRMVTITTYYF